MKHYISLAIAAVIIGFACFAIMYWGFKVNYKSSLDAGILLAFTGFLVELLKPRLKRFTGKKNED